MPNMLSATSQNPAPNLPKRRFGWRVAQLSGYSWILLAQCVVLAVYAPVMPLWLIGYGVAVIALQLPLLRPIMPQVFTRTYATADPVYRLYCRFAWVVCHLPHGDWA